MTKLETNDKIRVKKFFHNQLLTNGTERLYYDHQSGVCHQCKGAPDTEDHIIKCPTGSFEETSTCRMVKCNENIFVSSTHIKQKKDAMCNKLWLDLSNIDNLTETSGQDVMV